MTQLKSILPILGLVIMALAFTSCDKKEAIIAAITESDAAEIIESALQSEAGGLTSNLEDMAAQLVTAITSGQLCDTLYTDTVENEYQGGQIQASYSSDFSYEMACNSLDIPQDATVSTETESMYSSRRVDSDDSSNFEGNVAGLQPAASTLTMTGTYEQTGSQELHFRGQTDINSTLSVNLMNTEIDKESFDIESGSGTFLLTGSAEEETFLYEGSITFNGSNTATIVINGTTYEVDWN